MIRRFLGEYEKFECVADKCEATCCAGWAVEIDSETLEKYRDLKVDGVDFEDSCFLQQKSGDCFYLNDKKLCNLYLKHGEGIFCRTCDMYPRHIEEFEGVREYSLSLSCPEAAKMYLWGQTPEWGQVHDGGQTPLKVHEYEDSEGETEDYEDFDNELYSKLIECREFYFEILTSNMLKLSDKMKIILSAARKMQEEIDDGNISGCLDHIYDLKDKIEESNDVGLFKELNELEYMCYELHDFEFYRDIFCELEPLNEEFSNYVRGLNLYTTEDEHNFYVNHKEVECYFIKIIYYFLFTYMCGSVYDEYYFGMTAVSVFFVQLLKGIIINKEKEKCSVLAEKRVDRNGLYAIARA